MAKKKKKNNNGLPRAYSEANFKYIINYLVNKGIPLLSAFGVAGNLYAESSFYTHSRNPDDKGKESIGIAQWRADRNRALKSFAKSRNKSWQDLQTQLDFMWYELTNVKRFENVIPHLKAAKSIEDASYWWGHDFEVFEGYNNRNGSAHKSRADYGNILKNIWGSEFGLNDNAQQSMTPQFAIQSTSPQATQQTNPQDTQQTMYVEPENSLALQDNDNTTLNYENRPIQVDAYQMPTGTDYVQDQSGGYDIVSNPNYNSGVQVSTEGSSNLNNSFIVNPNSDIKFIDYRKAWYDYLRRRGSYQDGGSIFSNASSKYSIFNLKGSDQIALPKEAIDYRAIINKIFEDQNDPTNILTNVFNRMNNKSNSGTSVVTARSGARLPRKYYDGGYYDDIYNPSQEPQDVFTYKRESWKKLWEGVKKFFTSGKDYPLDQYINEDDEEKPATKPETKPETKSSTNKKKVSFVGDWSNGYEDDIYYSEPKSESQQPSQQPAAQPAAQPQSNSNNTSRVSLGSYDYEDDIYFNPKKKVKT